MKLFVCVCLILYAETESSLYTDLKDKFKNILRVFDNTKEVPRTGDEFRYELQDYFGSTRENSRDTRSAKRKAKIISKARNFEQRLNRGKNLPIPKAEDNEKFHKDPILNYMRRTALNSKYLASSGSVSSSAELRNWKDEWKDYWLLKKFEAINTTEKEGDRVNMVAARPWGVPCGDPSQHDMPWGSCMLPMECDTEFRIYRGDYFCGRTNFVCCALQHTAYDLYQAMDVSFSDSGFETDSKEKGRDHTKNKARKRGKEKKRRRRDRLNRKRSIKRLIKKIIKEIRKMLSRTYRNGTLARKKKTKQLKKFIKALKNKYKSDRKAVKDVHQLEMIKINEALKKRLMEIKEMNINFIKNTTFNEMLSSWTMTRQGARMLLEAYPDLEPYIQFRRSGTLKKPKDYLDYDIEYGLLYH